MLKTLNEYEQNKRENYFILGDLKYENNAFLSQFKKIQNLNPKGLMGNSQSKIADTFNTLMRKYKIRGYKIPDFSIKNNIFEIDPLLLANFRLHEYYNHQPTEELEKDTNLRFLEKVNVDVIKRLNKNFKDEEDYNNSNNQIQSLNALYDTEELEKMQKEANETVKYNSELKTYFETKNNKNKTLRKIPMQDKSSSLLDTKENFNKINTSKLKTFIFIIIY